MGLMSSAIICCREALISHSSSEAKGNLDHWRLLHCWRPPNLWGKIWEIYGNTWETYGNIWDILGNRWEIDGKYMGDSGL